MSFLDSKNEERTTITNLLKSMKNRANIIRAIARAEDNWLSVKEIKEQTKIRSDTVVINHLRALVKAKFFVTKNGVYRLNPKINPKEIDNRNLIAYLAWKRGNIFYKKWLKQTRKKAKGIHPYESWLADWDGAKLLVPTWLRTTDIA